MAAFSSGFSGRSVTMTSHVLLVPRLGKRWDVTSCFSMPCQSWRFIKDGTYLSLSVVFEINRLMVDLLGSYGLHTNTI
jgi:hypothetical protein